MDLTNTSNSGDAPVVPSYFLNIATNIVCGYTEDYMPPFLGDESIIAGRGYTNGIITTAKILGQKTLRKNGDPACVHYLKTIEFADRNAAENKELLSSLKKAGVPLSVLWFVAYFHDHCEDFRTQFPDASSFPDLIVEKCWKGDDKFKPLIITCLKALTDPKELEKSTQSPEEELIKKQKRLALQAAVANGLGNNPGDTDMDVAAGFIVSAVRSADKFATHYQDLERFLDALDDPEAAAKISESEIEKAIDRARLRYKLVVERLEKIPFSEKELFLDICDAIAKTGERLIDLKNQVNDPGATHAAQNRAEVNGNNGFTFRQGCCRPGFSHKEIRFAANKPVWIGLN